MIDVYGKWHEEKDYGAYPEDKWCDMDYMANWIRSVGYKPMTSMENLINMIFNMYDVDKFENGIYYAIEDDREYPDNLMVFVPDIEAYVNDNGGLSEFDYYC